MSLPRRGCLLTATACAALLLVGAIFIVWQVLTWDPRGPDVRDPRACPGSNVSLAEVAGHFGVTIPADAKDLRFSSDLHPLFGEYSLQLSFQTTASGLHAFLATAGLPRVDTADGSDDEVPAPVEGPSCGFGSVSLSHPRYYGEFPTSTGQFERQVAVDESDKARPRVVLSALDL
ncbi:hypothetical protein GCM10023191_093810 [Actinoallomurus oryzae]|uniref:Secreted protein n=1 Tax=Actinoallomurus oryzae TaxID=502180 RepID=A0ABP8R620_9ACTN